MFNILRLLPELEHINMKELRKTQDGEYYEHVADLMDSPNNEQPNGCQLRYINGRIYTGSKYTLPAKLCFLAEHLIKETSKTSDSVSDASPTTTKVGCVHGFREQEGEEILVLNEPLDVNADATLEAAAVNDIKIELNEYEVCDQNAMRAHALRLNPQYYTNAAPWHNTSAGCLSPGKKVRSPGSGTRRVPPMVSIPKSNLAIACAKKLKSLVENEESEEKAVLANQTSCIVATTKTKTTEAAKTQTKQAAQKAEKRSSQNAASPGSKKANTSLDTSLSNTGDWSRNEDKEMLIEMRVNVENQQDLFERIHKKLPNRTIAEIQERFYFLVQFLSNLQLKKD